MTGTLNWEKHGHDWPNRQYSRFVEAGGYAWHVQRAGAGEKLLLIHGTGASTHSWAGMLPVLARRFDVLAMDLPGHGFTRARHRNDPSLFGMVRGLMALAGEERFVPSIISGHSAGAAVALELALRLDPQPRQVVGLNGALRTFGGAAAWLAPLMAKAMAVNPVIVSMLSRSARDPERVLRLIKGTGSHPPEEYLRSYGTLFRSPAHVAGTLSMMAKWTLGDLISRVEASRMRVHLIAGRLDAAVPSSLATELAARYENISCEILNGLGHLAHEEDAERVAKAIEAVSRVPAGIRRAAS